MYKDTKDNTSKEIFKEKEIHLKKDIDDIPDVMHDIDDKIEDDSDKDKIN